MIGIQSLIFNFPPKSILTVGSIMAKTHCMIEKKNKDLSFTMMKREVSQILTKRDPT